MSILDRGPRGNVQNPFQVVDVGSIAYSNPRITSAFNGNLEGALNYILDAIYPNYKGTVATPADLPTTHAANDFWIVLDDGDGKSAGYVWSVISGVSAWVKRYDVDWSYDQILADTITRTSYMYAAKYGTTDRDAMGNPITGTFAGQRIFGGDQTGQNLTLTGNAVDLTGFVQFENTLRATTNNALDLGTTALKFRSGLFGTSVLAGTATLQSGSLTDSSGAMSFGANNLSTTGTLVVGTATLTSGSLTDSSGTLSHGSNNVTTTGTVTAAAGSKLGTISFGAGVFSTTSTAFDFSTKNVGGIGTLTSSSITTGEVDVGNLVMSGQTLKTTVGTTALILQAGSGGQTTTVQLNSSAQLNFDATVTGQLTVNGAGTNAITGAITSGSALKLSTTGGVAKVESLSGNLLLSPLTGVLQVQGSITPLVDATRDLGTTTTRYQNMYLSGGLSDGTNSTAMSVITSLRNINGSVANGMSLFYDSASNTWKPSIPDTEIVHNTLSGLTTGDAGHTQFPLLTGRSGGQTIQGGTAASESLTLDSTSNATKGFVLLASAAAPTADAVYGTSFTGINLGSSSRNFADIYSKGLHYGLRFEQYAGSGNYPASSGQNIGRVIYDTTTKQVVVDSGTAWVTAGNQKFLSDTTWSGSQTSQTFTVSANISDARTAIWALHDNTNSFERVYCKITAISATQVTVAVSPALPAGSYRLIGIN